MTVLFADLKGSMELLADRDPEEARKILDPVLERMMQAVHRYEGTVNQAIPYAPIALRAVMGSDSCRILGVNTTGGESLATSET